METTQLKNFADYGPYSYRNWCEKSEKEEIPRYAAEIQLFSDANFIGSRIEHGPYTVMNAQPYSLGETEQFMYARLVLRYEQHSDLNQDPTSTFRKTDISRYHGGTSSDEIASLYSLCWGVRIKGGGMIREFGQYNGYGTYGKPRTPTINETPIFSPSPDGSHILQWHYGTKNLNEIDEQIRSYILLNPNQASALICSTRLYQDAVWLAENNPETSWLLLVSAIEVAANYWYPKEKISDNLVEQLKHFKPELFEELNNLEHDGAKSIEIVSKHLESVLGASKKFRQFLSEFRPKEPPSERPISYQINWSNNSISKILSKIYEYRSLALHDGKPFPKFMCMPPRLDHQNNIPYESPDIGIAASTRGASWEAKDLPMHLHIFEYIVRHSLLKWWDSMVKSNSKSDD